MPPFDGHSPMTKRDHSGCGERVANLLASRPMLPSSLPTSASLRRPATFGFPRSPTIFGSQRIEHHETPQSHRRVFRRLHPGSGLHPAGGVTTYRPFSRCLLPTWCSELAGHRPVGVEAPQERSRFTAALQIRTAQDLGRDREGRKQATRRGPVCGCREADTEASSNRR
jgi:hypothetical protein